MSKNRNELIRVASQLPVGHPKRRAILAAVAPVDLGVVTSFLVAAESMDGMSRASLQNQLVTDFNIPPAPAEYLANKYMSMDPRSKIDPVSVAAMVRFVLNNARVPFTKWRAPVGR